MLGRFRKRRPAAEQRTAATEPEGVRVHWSLLVLEGRDQGRCFPLIDAEIAIGRRAGPAGDVQLEDPTVSSHQATLRRVEGRWTLEHAAGASNPTLLNGERVSRAPLRAGDRVEFGRVVLELREPERRRAQGDAERTELVAVAGASDSATTQMVVTPASAAQLRVLQGPPELHGRSFALLGDELSIGRRGDCDVSIPDPSISRVHARLVREGEALWLEHKSQTNSTALNGEPVADRARVFDGDEIRVAGAVLLRVAAPGQRREAAPRGAGTLSEVMEQALQLEERIEQDFVREGSFLDIDVVDSYGMKAGETRTERVVVSFERFRSYVERGVVEHRGRILNCNGDEVMAFFPSADDAVASARAILGGLADWNARQNRLGRPFQVRCGLHTGRSAVDLASGIAYSPVLDGAGHLQKAAPVGGLLISGESYRALSDPGAFEKAGVLEKDALETWVLRADG